MSALRDLECNYVEDNVHYQSEEIIDEDNLYNTIVPASSVIIKSDIENVPNISDDFEEVSIDGRSSSSSSILTTITNNTKTSTIFTCKPCKIYFPLQHMFEKHMKTIHRHCKSVEKKRKKNTKSILERLKEKAGGYRKNTDGLYLCNYCSYASSVQTAVSSHVARKHGNFRKSVAVRTSTVTVAIEPASMDVKKELVEDVEIINEEVREETELMQDGVLFDADAEIMTGEIELIGEEMEVLGDEIEIITEETDLISQEQTETVPIETELARKEENDDDYDTLFGNHKKINVQKKIYNCPYCDFHSKRRSIMHTHINSEHNDEWKEAITRREKEKVYTPLQRDHTCYYCHFAATTRSTLNAHTRRKHPGYLQPTKSRKQPPTEMHCDQCDFKTMDRHKIQMHIERKHVTECRYTCEYCGKKFKVKCDLTSHIRFQHFRTPTVCDVCGKICSNSNALRVHQKREHYKPDFECSICKRRMVSQENLEEHIQRQHEQRIKFICEQCGKVFDQQNKLKQHTMTHTGERPHNCHLCGKSFARRAVFRQHLLIHTGQRPYVCDICGKSFTQKPGLICHRKMHPGDKPPLPVVYIDHILDKFVQKLE